MIDWKKFVDFESMEENDRKLFIKAICFYNRDNLSEFDYKYVGSKFFGLPASVLELKKNQIEPLLNELVDEGLLQNVKDGKYKLA